jgi:hypothetical protein
MAVAKESMITPAKKAYNDFCDQYEKGLNEMENLQKQAIEQTFGMIAKMPMMEKMPVTGMVMDAKPAQLKFVVDGYAQMRKVSQEMRKQTNDWMNAAESMVPAL